MASSVVRPSKGIIAALSWPVNTLCEIVLAFSGSMRHDRSMKDETPNTPLSETTLGVLWETAYANQAPRYQAKGWRTLREWSQKRMADKLSLAIGTVGRVENGHSVNQRTARAYHEHTGIKLWP